MGTENTCSTGSTCTGRLCGVIFKLVLVGLLTCIASSLWEIEKSVARMVPAAARP